MCGKNTCNYSWQLDVQMGWGGITVKFPLGKEGSGTIYLRMSKFSGISILFWFLSYSSPVSLFQVLLTFLHFSLAPFTEVEHDPWVQFMGSQRVGHGWMTSPFRVSRTLSSSSWNLLMFPLLSSTLQMHLGNNGFPLIFTYGLWNISEKKLPFSFKSRFLDLELKEPHVGNVPYEFSLLHLHFNFSISPLSFLSFLKIRTPMLVCMHAKSIQSCPALPSCHQVPLSTGILQARILEWVAMPSSRGSSQPRDQTCVSYVSCISRQVFFLFVCLFFTTSSLKKEKKILLICQSHISIDFPSFNAIVFFFFNLYLLSSLLPFIP